MKPDFQFDVAGYTTLWSFLNMFFADDLYTLFEVQSYMFNTYSNLLIFCQETAHKILSFKTPWLWSFENTRYLSKHTDVKVDYV